jgi:hypothetical protein
LKSPNIHRDKRELCDTRHRRLVNNQIILAENEPGSHGASPWILGSNVTFRRSYRMRSTNMKGAERLIAERWPKLKNKAQTERNPEKLIAILEEMDDLLFNLEMRLAAQNESLHSKTDAGSQSDWHELISDGLPGDSEGESQ